MLFFWADCVARHDAAAKSLPFTEIKNASNQQVHHSGSERKLLLPICVIHQQRGVILPIHAIDSKYVGRDSREKLVACVADQQECFAEKAYQTSPDLEVISCPSH